MTVPTWEVAQIMRHHLYRACLDHRCTALSQLQQVLRLNGQAHSDSVVELILRRLDGQGLEISSPSHSWSSYSRYALVPTVWGLVL